jgi:hypothetical protein
MGRARLLGLLPLLWLAACSMESAINRFSSPEDRAFAQRFVDDVRSGNEAALKAEFDPELWRKSADQLPQARPLFPAGKGETKLIGYQVSTNFTNGSSFTSKEFVLVTTDRTHWTRTRIVTAAEGGPDKVVAWNVNGFDRPPPELQVYEAMDRFAPWLQGGMLVGLIGGIALVWWLVRRSRRSARLRP